ncbi:MAG: cell division protein FtsQ, partial [Alphaproteobacteria bacterium]
IRDIVPARFAVSSFDLDLDVLRDQIAALDAVSAVRVRIRPGGVLAVNVTERQPAVVWRGPAGTLLLDATGHRIAMVTARAARPDLPLIAGAGADARVGEALEILAAAGPLSGRVRGLVRVGERRWDLWLDRDQIVLLPEEDPVSALQQVLAMDEAQDLLSRNVTRIDMRNPARPTLRLAPAAAHALRQIRSLFME